MEIESMRSELKGCNLDVTLWELFDSQSRQEGALRGMEQNRNGLQADENVHGAEYVEWCQYKENNAPKCIEKVEINTLS